MNVAPPTMPTSHVDASTPYPHAPASRVLRAKKISATLSMAANRMTAPITAKATTSTRSRRITRNPARACCSASLDSTASRRTRNRSAQTAITTNVTASTSSATLVPTPAAIEPASTGPAIMPV